MAIAALVWLGVVLALALAAALAYRLARPVAERLLTAASLPAREFRAGDHDLEIATFGSSPLIDRAIRSSIRTLRNQPSSRVVFVVALGEGSLRGRIPPDLQDRFYEVEERLVKDWAADAITKQEPFHFITTVFEHIQKSGWLGSGPVLCLSLMVTSDILLKSGLSAKEIIQYETYWNERGSLPPTVRKEFRDKFDDIGILCTYHSSEILRAAAGADDPPEFVRELFAAHTNTEAVVRNGRSDVLSGENAKSYVLNQLPRQMAAP